MNSPSMKNLKVFAFALGFVLSSCSKEDDVIMAEKSLSSSPSVNAMGSWHEKANLGRPVFIAFSNNKKAFAAVGFDRGGAPMELWEYDPIINSWNPRACFPGVARIGVLGFSIGEKVYMGIGSALVNNTGKALKDFWEFDPETNKWSRKADYPSSALPREVEFIIGNKAYIVTQYEYPDGSNHLWEYDPNADKWTRKADFPGLPRRDPAAFSIGTKGYLGTGIAFGEKRDFWEYDQLTNKWTEKAEFGGSERHAAVGFSIGDFGYIGTGVSNVQDDKKDLWEFNPKKNKWTRKADLEGSKRFYAIGLSIGNKGYIGFGTLSGPVTRLIDFWEFDPN